MRVEVTQEDIDAGRKRDCYACPIALSIKRQGFGSVAVSQGNIWVVGCEYDTPLHVEEFIKAFDEGKPVKPFAFTL